MIELSHELEERLEKNLIWIIASRRSGTSWLAKELLSHNTKIMDEPLIGFHIAGLLGRNSPFYRRIDESKSRKHYFFCTEFKEIWLFYLRKLLLNRIYAQFENLDSKIIIKEPNGSMGADIISESLPNSKIVLLLRDGRDVIHSNLAQISPEGFASKQGKIVASLQNKKILNEIKFRAKDWNSLVDILLSTYENHNKKLRYKVKYEDLRRDTFAELKKLYEFIEVSISDPELNEIIEKYTFENLPDEIKGIGTQRQFAKVEIWRKNFTSDEIITMNEIMEDKLRLLGYEL